LISGDGAEANVAFSRPTMNHASQHSATIPVPLTKYQMAEYSSPMLIRCFKLAELTIYSIILGFSSTIPTSYNRSA